MRKFTLTKEELYKLYWMDNLSLKIIAQKTNVSTQTVLRHMKKWNIKRKSYSEANKIYFQNNPLSSQEKEKLIKLGKSKEIIFDKEYLIEQYSIQQKSSTEIAKENGCSNATVLKNLKKFNIPIRTKSENKKGNKNPSYGKTMERSPRWRQKHSKDTLEKIRKNVPRSERHKRWKRPEERIETINGQIRNCSKMKQWRMSVFSRDKFTCTKCGRTRKDGVILNADHIVPFHKIKKKYNIFSLEQAIQCIELWDTDNGRTLCVECHKSTETWGGKSKKAEEIDG
jgi:predicted DNA-binding protein YlxM (UPF0122 family)/5-methylcytosine-specific restriction endonuclease McrA